MHLVKKDTICKEFPQNAKVSPGSFPEAVVRKLFWDVLENFAKFTENDLYWSLFLIKLQSSILQTPAARTFSCELCRIFKNTSGWLVVQALGKMPLGKMSPGKSPQENWPPENCTQEITQRKITPPHKIFLQIFSYI